MPTSRLFELRSIIEQTIQDAVDEIEWTKEHPDEECGTPLQLHLDDWHRYGDELYALSQEGYYKMLLRLIPADSKARPAPIGRIHDEVQQLKITIEKAIDYALEEHERLEQKMKKLPPSSLCETSLLGAIGDWYYAQKRLRELEPDADLWIILDRITGA